MTQIILNAEIIGYLDGERLDQKYRMVMEQRDGRWVLCPEQAIDGKFTEHSRLPGWRLSTLLKREYSLDVIYIDFDQDWGIAGVDAAIKEALNHI